MRSGITRVDGREPALPRGAGVPAGEIRLDSAARLFMLKVGSIGLKLSSTQQFDSVPRATIMSGHIRFAITGLVLLLAAMGSPCLAVDNIEATNAGDGKAVGLFRAMGDGQVDVKFIAFNDRAARILITNKLKQPIHLQMPEAFAGVPVLAQLGGGGGGRGGGGFGGGGGGQGGGQQSVGGGGGGLGGGGQGGGGGGFFSIAPERTAKINVPVVCLDHGLQNPSSSNPYKLVPAEDHLDRPAVIELLKAFGRGELQHGATQAAAWHLNSDLNWDELSTKLQGTRRSVRRPPYFSREEIQAGIAYANEAGRLAEMNAESYRRIQAEKAQRDNVAAEDASSSEALSTSDAGAIEPTAATE
jgi:hypothetical protein